MRMAEAKDTLPSPKREPPLAWFVLFVVVVFNILNGINWIAFSVLYVEFTDQFQATKAQGGWIGSLQVGVTQLFGEFVNLIFCPHFNSNN